MRKCKECEKKHLGTALYKKGVMFDSEITAASEEGDERWIRLLGYGPKELEEVLTEEKSIDTFDRHWFPEGYIELVRVFAYIRELPEYPIREYNIIGTLRIAEEDVKELRDVIRTLRREYQKEGNSNQLWENLFDIVLEMSNKIDNP